MKIQRLVVDSSGFRSTLCELGAQLNADKSPYHKHPQLHKHPYTSTYQQLFAPLKNKEINFCEIGIAGGASALMWMNYFPKAKFLFMDRDQDFLNNINKANHPRMKTKLVDVGKDYSVADCVRGENLDVIIDDSSHDFDHQIRIINESFSSLKNGGIIVIEDIYRDADENKYNKALEYLLPRCSFASFIICNHEERLDSGWNNSKLLILIKE